jgi:hypothetical protein
MNFPYFADTTERGDRESKHAQRLSDGPIKLACCKKIKWNLGGTSSN